MATALVRSQYNGSRTVVVCPKRYAVLVFQTSVASSLAYECLRKLKVGHIRMFACDAHIAQRVRWMPQKFIMAD